MYNINKQITLLEMESMILNELESCHMHTCGFAVYYIRHNTRARYISSLNFTIDLKLLNRLCYVYDE